MGSVKIDVESSDILFIPEIFGFGRTIGIGQRAQVAEGVTFRNDGGVEHRGLDIPALFHFTLEFAEPIAQGVTATVIAAWLVAKFKGHVRPERGDKLTINRTVVELEEGEITRIINETLTSEKPARK